MNTIWHKEEAPVLPLSERQQRVLFSVIEHFNATGEPASSALVARCYGAAVSSATIRNVMGELEERGLLVQPHTSAGRVPTAQGMRFFVNYLYSSQRFAPPAPEALSRQTLGQPDESIERLARSTSAAISRLSSLTGIVSLASLSATRLKEIGLSLISERRMLAIVITEDGRVFNRVVRLEEPLEEVALVRMQNYLAGLVTGLTLEEARERVGRELGRLESRYQDVMLQALRLGEQALDEEPRSRLYVDGALNILDFAELTQNVDRVRELLRALEDHERVMDLLERLQDGRHLRTWIGPELGWELGDDLSLIVCGFERHGQEQGLVGVLGPMRMDYARVIPLVEQAARLLSEEPLEIL